MSAATAGRIATAGPDVIIGTIMAGREASATSRRGNHLAAIPQPGRGTCEQERRDRHPEQDPEPRVEHDLYYIDNWSILFDLRVLASTPLSLTRDRAGSLSDARFRTC